VNKKFERDIRVAIVEYMESGRNDRDLRRRGCPVLGVTTLEELGLEADPVTKQSKPDSTSTLIILIYLLNSWLNPIALNHNTETTIFAQSLHNQPSYFRFGIHSYDLKQIFGIETAFRSILKPLYERLL